MFRFIHTADWHLGQSFHGYDRDYEHGRFLDWLLATLAERKPHALVVSGDIFDTVNPSAGAQRRFFNFLARAHETLPTLQVVVTAGNHDAAARLEAPSELFETLNIAAVGTVARDASGAVDYSKFLVPLKGDGEAISAIVVAIPFLRPSDVPELPDAKDPYLEGMRVLYRDAAKAACELRDRSFPGVPIIAMAHCHLQGAEESRDSERRLIIGGAEALDETTFPAEFSYVALGHLHRPQRFQNGRIQYSGSPIPLSFSEKDYAHRVVEVSIDSDAALSFEMLSVPRTVQLVSVPPKGAATINEVLQLLGDFSGEETMPVEERPFVEVRVLEDGPDPSRRARIAQVIEGKAARLAVIKLETPQRHSSLLSQDELELSLESLGSLDPITILESAHLERFGVPIETELLAAFREVLAAETLEEPA